MTDAAVLLLPSDVLNLSRTAMNGTIPSEIEQLEILGEVDTSASFFLLDGKLITAHLFHAGQDRIVLSNSSFSGTIPVSISKLYRMRK